MLQQIRDNIQGTAAKIIIALIAIPFAVFGIDAFFTGGTPEVARVDGEAITQPELDYAMELQRRRLLAQMDGKIDASKLEQTALEEPALQALIERKVLERSAQNAGLGISDAMLNQIIVSTPAFQDNGEFSQARYEGLLANNGMSPATYKRMLREDLLAQHLLGGIASSEFVTDKELEELARITLRSADVRYVTVPLGDGAGIEIADGDIAAYYEQHVGEFETTETVRIEYLESRLEDLYADVDEEKLRAEYERRIAGFAGRTQRHAAHIMLTDMPDEEARSRLGELRTRILAGEDFAALAGEYSQDFGSAQAGGDLGYSNGDAFPEAFEKALAALEPGGVSEPVRTEDGWHLIRLVDQRIEDVPSFEGMRAEIELDLKRRAAEPLFVERNEKIADGSFNAEGLQEVARNFGLQTKTSEAFGRSGGEGVLADPRVVAAAFSEDVLQKGHNSDLIEISKEDALVLRVAEHQPSRRKDLAEVSEEIRQRLLDQRRRQRVAEIAAQLREEIAAGKSVEELARAHGYEWQVALQHRLGGPELELDFSRQVFASRSAEGRSVGEYASTSGDVMVFEAGNYKPGDFASLPEEGKKAFRRSFLQSASREAGVLYQKQLRDSAKIEIL